MQHLHNPKLWHASNLGQASYSSLRQQLNCSTLYHRRHNLSARVYFRTSDGQFNHESAQNCTRSAKMSGEVSQSSCSSEPPQKKRCVAIRTVQNWISSCDRELGTALWLKYEKYDRDHVASINCSICTTFDEKIRGSRRARAVKLLNTHQLRRLLLPWMLVLSRY